MRMDAKMDLERDCQAFDSYWAPPWDQKVAFIPMYSCLIGVGKDFLKRLLGFTPLGVGHSGVLVAIDESSHHSDFQGRVFNLCFGICWNHNLFANFPQIITMLDFDHMDKTTF